MSIILIRIATHAAICIAGQLAAKVTLDAISSRTKKK